MKENILIELSKQFAVDTINLCAQIKENKRGNPLLNQLLRSGTSIGANVKEAIRGQSKQDFIAKMNISLKEASETEYWLELLHETDNLNDNEFESIYKECQELLKILITIVKNSK